jgi:hypothetical protein
VVGKAQCALGVTQGRKCPLKLTFDCFFIGKIAYVLAQKGGTFGVPLDLTRLDLELAWRRVKNDAQTERTFVQAPFEETLVQFDVEEWLAELRAKIGRGYQPRSAIITDIPKGNGAVRPAALLALEDRVVYAACVGAVFPQISAALRWSQGRVDYSYRLAESSKRVDWFTNAFVGWSGFRKASLARLEAREGNVVLTDITGFYENIDLAVLFSDLRSLGCDAEILQLLQTCLFRWCVVPGRGLPQGQSPSDILAKVYMNPVDQLIVDRGIDFICYVDDMRVFASSVSDCKKALMFIAQALRRRGLNLQSAKTEILTAEQAGGKIEGITAVIVAVQAKYREFLEAIQEYVNPYATISEIEANVSAADAPLEVVREVFQEAFIDGNGPFNKTLFHFLLNRLGAQGDSYATDYCLGQFGTRPQETKTILDYVRQVGVDEQAFKALEVFLNSPDCIYDYQVYEIYRWLYSLDKAPSAGLIAVARRMTFDNARTSYLRSICRAVLQENANMADLERMEDSYASFHDELEKAQVLISLKGMEIGRRNSFFGRVANDGFLCRRAVRLVKEQRV